MLRPTSRPFGRPRRGPGRGLPATRATLVALLALPLLSACSMGEVKRGSLPVGVTNQAGRVTHLWVGAWIAALLIGLAVWGLILGTAFIYRRRKDETGLPAQVRYNLPVEVLYTVVPIVIVLVYFFFTARDENAIAATTKNPPNSVNVVGKRWSWDFNYINAQGKPVAYETGTPGRPPLLVLPRGEKVQFVLTSRDVNHSFWVPAFLYKLDVIAGRINKFEVTPQKTGTYVGKCAEFCGVDHARMLFNVKIVEPAAYRTYLADLVRKGQTGALPNDTTGLEPADTPAGGGQNKGNVIPEKAP